MAKQRLNHQYPRMKQVAFLFLTGLFIQAGHAQFRCGFETATEKAQQADPLYRINLQQTNEQLQRFIQQQSLQRTSSGATTVYIPVAVHVVHTGGAVGSSYNPSNTQINGAINYLNAVYDGTWTGAGGSILGAGDLQIRFVLATRDPENNPTTGIVRVNGSSIANYTTTGVGSNGTNEMEVKNLSRWDPFKYYNIWLVNRIDGCDGISGCSSFIAGYAYFPYNGNVGTVTRDRDGTVMLASQMVAGQKTLPHELGHAFNLFHPFQGETAQAGANGCPPNTPADGDQCADTNPVTNPADDGEALPFSCRTGNGCYGLVYNDNTERNFMSYTNCYRLFTADQKARMQASVNTTLRASQASSWGNNQVAYPTVWSVPSSVGATPVSNLAAANVAGIMSVSLNNRTVHSLNSTQDGGYVNNAAKWYNLFHLERNTNYTMNIRLLGGNAEQLGVWIDYNNNGTFSLDEQLYLQTNIPAATAAAGININFTTPGLAPGAIVRMRIIEDLSTIYGVPAISSTTTSLVYGQAEDYPVFVQTAVLPMRLLHFDGKAENGRVRLNWSTEQEENTKSFGVEASADGRHFNTIGNVAARPSDRANQYTFATEPLAAGAWYFRLKMIDQDERFTYSKTIRVQWSTLNPLQVLGNPFKSQLTVQLPAAVTGKVQVRMIDMNGKTVQTSQYRLNQQSQFLFRIEHTSLPAGTYLLRTHIGNDQYSNMVLKQ